MKIQNSNTLLNKEKYLKTDSFSVENLTNASIVIKTLDEKIVIDPWFEDGIYDGTWHNFPRLNEAQKEEALSGVGVCMYTHLHKDHFCINTAKKYFLPSTKFLIPKVYGWQVIQGVLNKNGFALTHVLECSEDVYHTENFKIMALPPLNVTGLEASTLNEMSIDGGFCLVHKRSGVKTVFLADDNLYSEKRVNENIELLKNPDLIAFAYSGFASDYPFKFNFSDDEMVAICKEQEEKRFTTQVRNLQEINPKCVMPYSSEFVAVGSHAEKWLQILGEVWTSNKTLVASKYASKLGVDGVSLYPGDYVLFDENGNRTDHLNPFSNVGPYSNQALLDYASKHVKEIKQPKKITQDASNGQSSFADKLKLASKNFKGAIEKHKLSPKQNLIICINENHFFLIDTEGNFADGNLQESKNPFLRLDVDYQLMQRLLEGELHWDDACLSLKLSWQRVPNIFCSDTLNALNYLKI